MLSRAPFVGIAFCFIVGIVLVDWLLSRFSFSSYQCMGLALLVLPFCFFLYIKRQKVAFGVSFSLILVFLGCFSKVAVEERLNAEIALLAEKKYNYYEASVKSLPEKRKKSVRVEVLVTRIKLADGQWFDTNLTALVNINVTSPQIPKPGEMIIAKGKLNLPMQATNPGQFDYRAFLRNKGILWTGYLQSESFQIIQPNAAPGSLALLSLHISDWADQIFRKSLLNDQSYGLVKAMLLGRRDDLGVEQVDSYVASGTVHILSVSGMHVAIIFLIISYSLGWIKRFRFGSALYLICVIALLGFYAFATGLAPSVQRATLMCIVFVFAEVFGRKNNAMNTLAISAFLILWFDPAALYDVGFQLSYLAMTGIFLFYEPIKSICIPGNRILKFAWQVTAMSFAAQLATFPVSLYYFHQFPTYFWLVNPFVIAFTNILLPASLFLLLVSLTNLVWLNSVAALVVDWSARLTDLSVAIPEKLPGYLIANLHLGKAELWILYAILLLIWYAWYSRDYVYLKYGFAITFLFIAVSVAGSMHTFLRPADVAHDIPKHSVKSFKRDHVLYLVSDAGFPADTNAFDFYLKNYATSQEVSKIILITAATMR